MSKTSIVLVIFQLSTMIYLAATGLSSDNPIVIGFQVLGIGVALWGLFAGNPFGFNMQPEVKSETLFTKGPFGLVRNPMYLGLILVFVPSVIVSPSLMRWIALIVLITVLLFKIFSEEIFLQQKFKEEYTDYKTKTYRLIPYIF